MKKLQMVALLIVLLFCIDYSVTELLGFQFLFDRIHDLDVYGSVYAFLVGISAFYSILLFKKEDE